MKDKLLTRRETAALLSLRPQTLATWSMTGRHLKVVKIGRSARYRESDVERLIAGGSPPESVPNPQA